MSDDASFTRILAQHQSAIAQDPNNPQLRVALGQLLADAGRFHDAAQHFLGAARLFDQQQLLREAAENCARVLTLDPGNEGAVGLLRQLGDDDTSPARRVGEGPIVLHPSMEFGGTAPEDLDSETLPLPPLASESEGGASRRSSAGSVQVWEQDQGPAGSSEENGASAFKNSSPGSKRFRLRSRRPRRRVSPLDRTVLDVDAASEEGSASASRESSSSRRGSSPELSTPGRDPGLGRIKGTLPLRRRRKTVSPLDRTEIDRRSDPPKRSNEGGARDPRGRRVATGPSDALAQDEDVYSTRIERRSRRPGGEGRHASPSDEERTEVQVVHRNSEGAHLPVVERGEAQGSRGAVWDHGARDSPSASPWEGRQGADGVETETEMGGLLNADGVLLEGAKHLARTVSFGRGEIVLREGGEGSDLFFVETGTLQVYRQCEDGPILLGELKEGDFFGELGMFGDGRRHATVRALEPARVYLMTRGQVRRFLDVDKAAGRVLRRAYRDRLREMALATSSLLRDLPRATANRLLGACKAVTARKGQVVLSTSRGAPAFHLVLLGALEVLGPEEEVLGELRDGDAFGHPGALRREVSPYDVRSLGFAQMLRMDARSLMQLVAEDASLAARLDWAVSDWVERFDRS